MGGKDDRDALDASRVDAIRVAANVSMWEWRNQ